MPIDGDAFGKILPPTTDNIIPIGGRDMHIPRNTNQPPKDFDPNYSCIMSSVNDGGALTYNFDPDPEKVGWTMSAAIQTVPSRGGQVSYATTRTIGPLLIAGILRSRWDLIELGQFVSEHMAEAIFKGAPLRFIYPQRDIDFSLYIQTISEIAIDSSVGEIVPYVLTCAVTQDHSALTKVQLSELGIPMEVGWIDVQTAYETAKDKFPQLFAGGGGTPEDNSGEEDTGEEEVSPEGEETGEPTPDPSTPEKPFVPPLGGT